MANATSGTGIDLTVNGEITYTTTTTNLKTQAVTTSTTTQSVSISRDGVSLSTGLTVAGASFQQNVGFGDQANVTWSAFGPTPTFNPDTEPR